jgi:hypothetical protein
LQNNFLQNKPLGSSANSERRKRMNNRVLLFGALIGAATGLVAALMLQRRAEQTGQEISLSAGDGIQLGVLVMGLLRAVSALAEKDDNR